MIYSSPNVYSFGIKPKTGKSPFLIGNTEWGPGEYSGNPDKIKEKTQTFSFAKDGKMKHPKSFTPGPGNYTKEEYGTFGKTSPGYSWGKSVRKSDFDKSNSKWVNYEVGPGAYQTDPNITKQNKGKFVNKSDRFEKNNKNTPGPGDYQQQEYFGKTGYKHGIPQHEKKTTYLEKEINSGYTPGPGAYDWKSDFTAPDKKGVILRGKPKDIQNLKTPGVGEYEIDPKTNKPKFYLGKDKRKDLFGKPENNVGPGEYESQSDFYHTTPKQVKGATFNRDPKLKMMDSKTPGPGYYRVPCSMVHVPLYTNDKFERDFKYV